VMEQLKANPQMRRLCGMGQSFSDPTRSHLLTGFR
jgi:hypothetical protein